MYEQILLMISLCYINFYYTCIFILYSRELGSKGDLPLLLPQPKVAEGKDASGAYVILTMYCRILNVGMGED